MDILNQNLQCAERKKEDKKGNKTLAHEENIIWQMKKREKPNQRHYL